MSILVFSFYLILKIDNCFFSSIALKIGVSATGFFLVWIICPLHVLALYASINAALSAGFHAFQSFGPFQLEYFRSFAPCSETRPHKAPRTTNKDGA
jgi:hypothetical protein